MSDEKKKIAIDGRRPVIIDVDKWSTIARASWYEGAIESQANRSAWIRVRRHADGRTIVYARFESRWANESDIYSGMIGDESTTESMILTVCERIGHPYMAQMCLADLPAEEL